MVPAGSVRSGPSLGTPPGCLPPPSPVPTRCSAPPSRRPSSAIIAAVCDGSATGASWIRRRRRRSLPPTIRRRGRGAGWRSWSTARPRCRRWPPPCAPRARTCTSPAGTSRRTSSWSAASDPIAIGPLLAELAERIDVRVMVWAGSPVPLFHPTRKEVEAEVRKLTRDTNIQAFRDPREHPVHCHHEKTIVIDDEVAFVDGIDMTDQAGDRFDSSEHPARRKLGWHDVGTRLRGPGRRRRRRPLHHALARGQRRDAGAADRSAARHRRAHEHRPGRAHRLGGHVRRGPQGRLPHPRVLRPRAPLGTATTSTSRTSSSGRRRSSTSWSPSCGIRRRHDFRLVVLLPARANNGQDDTRGQLAVLADADDTGNSHFLATTIRSRTRRPRRPALRPRQGRHRRRPLADDRLGQPQRPLLAQRHRDERRHRRRRPRAGHARAPVGRAPRSSSRRRSPASRPPGGRRALAPDRDGAAAPPRAPASRRRTA